MSRPKGLPKTGGRQKGTPNKTTGVVKTCVKKLLEEYMGSETFATDFASLEPKERMLIAEKFMNYIVPKMQSVSVEDESRTKDSTVSMLIQLRDGNRNAIMNLSEEESEEIE